MDVTEWDTSLVRGRRFPRIGYSYPSHQTRGGPAPLASFEDLPTDDQKSPDSPDVPDLDLDDDLALDGGSRLCDRSDSATPVNELPDARTASVATLTQLPDVALKTRCLVTDTGLSYGRRKSSPIPGKQSVLSANSPSPDAKRKSSWTDVLFRRRSRSRSPVEPADANHADSHAKEEKKKKKGVFSFLKKKSGRDVESEQQPAAETTSNKPAANKRPQHLLTPVSAAPQSKSSPDDRRIAWQTLRLPRLSITEASLDGNSPATDSLVPLSPARDSELDELQALDTPTPTVSGGSPVDRKMAWEVVHEQMKIGEPNEQQHQPNQTTADVCQWVLPKRKLKRRTDTVDSEVSECQSLPEVLPSASRPKRDLNLNDRQQDAIVTTEQDEDLLSDEDNSSTSSSRVHDAEDRSSFMKRIVISSDDNEVATLLSHVDTNDADENSVCDSSPSRSSQPTEAVIATDPPDPMQTSLHLTCKKDRQDLTLMPLDRPRSTTPVAVAPLEEYLRRASLSPERAAAERIRLSLPGDQFATCVRSKDPRKSNPQIWMDFCEKAVGSPKVKKMYNWSEMGDGATAGCQLLSPHNVLHVASPISPNDAFTPSDTPLTPVTPLEDHKWNAFNDSFDPSDYLLSQRLALPSECNKCMCKLRRKGVFASASPGSSTDDSPLMEHFADATALEHQVLLPPKTLPPHWTRCPLFRAPSGSTRRWSARRSLSCLRMAVNATATRAACLTSVRIMASRISHLFSHMNRTASCQPPLTSPPPRPGSWIPVLPANSRPMDKQATNLRFGFCDPANRVAYRKKKNQFSTRIS